MHLVESIHPVKIKKDMSPFADTSLCNPRFKTFLPGKIAQFRLYRRAGPSGKVAVRGFGSCSVDGAARLNRLLFDSAQREGNRS